MKKTMILTALLCILLVFTLVGCGDGNDGSTDKAPSGSDSIVGKWYDTSNHCLDVRSDGTYRLTSDYGTGTWKKLDDGYEFYDFYGSVTEATLVTEDGNTYVKLGRTKYYKASAITTTASGGSSADVPTDDSFLKNTTPSEGLAFRLSVDGTYYILTDLGTCRDKHVVVPEYPVDYNPTIPLKEVGCTLSGCEYVTLPASVTRLSGIDSSIKGVNYLGELEDFCGLSGMYGSNGGNYDFGVCLLYVNGRALTKELTVPETVTSIEENFLRGYNRIETVTIPGDGVTIGAYAFHECAALEAITLSDGIRSIGEDAFEGTAYYEKSANWEMGLLYIGKYLVDAKADITAAQVKDGTLGIGDSALSSKRNLVTVVLPSSLKWIGVEAFYGSSAITSVTVPASVTHIGNYAFSYCAMTIYCEASSKPEGWSNNWGGGRNVIWGYEG